MTENKAHRGWAGAIDLLGFSGLLRSVMGRKSFEVVVVQRRFATPEEVRQGQRLQAERRARGEDLHLGQILLEQRIISGHQLAEALSRSGERRLSTSEATFRLATRLQSGFSPSQKVVLACSAVEEPALLDLVSQLSLALALMDGGPVLLVDGNLRTPWLHRYYSLPAAPGLSDVLRGKVEFDVAVKSLELKDLSVLTAGSPEPDALSVLDSIKLSTLIAHSSTRFRRVRRSCG